MPILGPTQSRMSPSIPYYTKIDTTPLHQAATAVWVLNQTDSNRTGAERKSLISRFSGSSIPRPH